MYCRSITLLFLCLLVPLAAAQPGSRTKADVLRKSARQGEYAFAMDRSDRKYSVHNGNKILTRFYNFGGIGDWTISGRYDSGIYPIGSGRSYIAEFTPVIAASVIDTNGQRIHIVSDGMVASGGKDISPAGFQWGFEPLPGYADPNQLNIAMSDDPDSWPETWPNRPSDWDGLWNGQYGKYNRADQESYFVMDDALNDEFAFYPDPTDSSRRGLGLELEVRGYQWSHVAAEDIIIWTYWITNRGTERLDSVVFGMYGDADVGDDGDQRDDNADFDRENAIVYQWDSDNHSSVKGGFKPAYFGWKFLESPGNPNDDIDNDFDGMVDESQFNGIDDDGDWDIEKDDLGSDGIGPEHDDYSGPDPDGSEGNGQPDVGEPNFEITDNDESDQIGLTSFFAAAWPAITVYNDEQMWQQMKPGFFDVPEQTIDQTFLYGSAYFSLEPGEKKKFAVAMLFGENRADILRNAVTMQAIYNADYSFAKPPDTPIMTAFAGDHQVTLYWDKGAESSRDLIYGRDFAGYRIYRSTEPAFIESWIITDAWGNKTFNKPVAIFDLEDGLTGPHPVAFNGIQFDMGEDSGLRHSWTDTTVQNGQIYYYSIASFDRGYDDDFFERGLSEFKDLQPLQPSESPTIIDIDAGGNVLGAGENVAVVTPNAPSAGYVPPNTPDADTDFVLHTTGRATGNLVVQTLDAPIIPDNWLYEVSFQNQGGTLSYFILNKETLTDTIFFENGRADLANKNLLAGSLQLKLPDSPNIFVEGIDYTVDTLIGRINLADSTIIEGIAYTASYQYYPVLNSNLLAGEPFNPIFEGMRLLVYNDPLTIWEEKSGWIAGDAGYTPKFDFSTNPYPADIEVRWYGAIGDSVSADILNSTPAPFEIWNISDSIQARFALFDNPVNGRWDPGDLLFILAEENSNSNSFSLSFDIDSLLITERLVSDSTVYDTVIVPVEPVEAGDILGIYSKKPFTVGDKYQFTSIASHIDVQAARRQLDDIAVVPNPYVVTASWEPQHVFVSGRGARKIYFIHLPKECTIRIFTLSGSLLTTIDHLSTDENGAEGWDVLSSDGLEIAYGIYLFHVEAPGIGDHIGKFAVIK